MLRRLKVRKGPRVMRHDQTSATPAPARVDPPPVHGLFRRAGVVEHLFGDIGPLLIRQRSYRLHPSGTPCRPSKRSIRKAQSRRNVERRRRDGDR